MSNITERPMLTNARHDRDYIAALLAMMVTVDATKPKSEANKHVKAKLLELSNAWQIRAFISQNAIIQEPPSNSKRLRAGSFLDPLNNILSSRLQQMNIAVGGNFWSSLELRMNDNLFAQVSLLNEREYSIEIGLKLIVQLFLGAITLSQPGSNLTSKLPNPYDPKYGNYAESIYESQAPLLQALNASAFKQLLPNEDWRRLLAFELFSKAIEFVLLHEFGHATRGHLEFLAMHGSPSVRTESGDRSASISALTNQLLESQADDTASLFMIAKMIHISQQHSFLEGPLMLGRYGFSVTQPKHAQLIIAYAVALLFIIIDAEDRGTALVGDSSNPENNLRDPTYPTPAYRSWRFHRYQHSMGVAPAPWQSCIEKVRDDLEADRFPHVNSIFENQNDLQVLEAFDQSLMQHSKDADEGRALMVHEGEYARLRDLQPPMKVPRLWGEARPSLLETLKQLLRVLGRKQ